MYSHSLDAVGRVEELADHLEITVAAMDVLDKLRQMPNETEDERAIVALGIRVFNNFACAWKLMARGYYQVAAMVLRDIVETVSLVNLFYMEPPLVEQWRKSDEHTRYMKFRPSAVRKALDHHGGRGKSKRGEIYRKFCNLAAHPTVEGFAMLRPQGMSIHGGPFFDITALTAVAQEMGMLGPQAGFAFCTHIDVEDKSGSAVAHNFLRTAMIYSNKHLGITYSQADIEALDQLYGQVM